MPATQARQRNRAALSTTAAPTKDVSRYPKPIPVAGRDAATSRLHNLIWLLTITTAFFAIFQLHRIYIRKLPPLSLNPLPDHILTEPPPAPVDAAKLAKDRAQHPGEAADRLEFVEAYKSATGEEKVSDKADEDAEGMDKLDAETLQKMYDALHSRGAYSDNKEERVAAEEQGREAGGEGDEKKTRSKRFLNLAKNLAKNVVSGMEGDSAEEIELKDDADLQK